MKPRWFLAVLLLFAFPCAVTVHAQPAAIEDLGTLGGDTFARAVNASGQAAGDSRQATFENRGFVTGGALLNAIPTFGGSESSASGLNDAAVVVGYARNAAGIARAFRYDAATSAMQDLGTLGGGYSFAYGINNLGAVAGYSETADRTDEAFVWTPAGMQSLGALGGVYSYAYGINDAGQVVGEAHTSDNRMRAFLYSGGSMQDLGTLGGPDSAALAINASGQVTGTSRIVGVGMRPFRLAPGGVMQELPTLGGTFGSGEAIGPDGTVVGVSTNAIGANRATMWTPAGDVMDLNDLIDPALGWTLVAATGINGSGQIVGYGHLGGATRAFRLTLPGSSPGSGGAPTIHAVSATPSSLWPANNKLVTVHVTVDATNTDGSAAACAITGVTSNEPAPGDIVIVGPWELQLRASRAGTGTGRVYRIGVECGSGPDATATSSTDVVVPKSQAGGAGK